jgi:hypothetical protein
MSYERLNSRSWQIVKNRDDDPGDCEYALPLAERACALRARNTDYQNTRGVAL